MSDTSPAASTQQPHQPRRIAPPTPRVALMLGAALVVAVVLYMGRHALTPFVVGLLLIYVLDPAVGLVARIRIGRRTVPRGLAVLLVYIATFFVVVEGLALLLGPTISELLAYLRDLPRLLAALDSLLAELRNFYTSLELPAPMREFIDRAIADLGQGAGQIDFGSLLPIAGIVAGTAATLFGFLIIPIWAFYILRDRVQLTERLDDVLPPPWRRDTWAVLGIIEKVFGKWIRAQILLGLIVGAATYGGLILLGLLVDERFLQFAVLLAVIAGLLELLPIIGPIIAMIPTMLVALTTSDPAVAVAAVLILYIAVQQLENAVLVPKIQGDAVELHPSVVILALIIGGAIAGIPGAILSIPITAAARGIFRYLFHRLDDDEVPDAAAGAQSDRPADKPDVTGETEGPAVPPAGDDEPEPGGGQGTN